MTDAQATAAQAADAPAAARTPEQLLAVYRERRAMAVTQPKGNLALVNTQWITGDPSVLQPIWGVPGQWAPLAPGESGLHLIAAASDGVRIDGELVDGEIVVRGKDDTSPSEIVFSETVTGFVIAGENGSYALRVWDADAEGIRQFGSIDSFDYNPDWVVSGVFTPHEGGVTLGFEHLKDDGRTREMVIPGSITFQKDGMAYDLAAFASGRALQLVFADATNGDSTYSVGRFLFVAPNTDGSITLDFNRAVLPPCAFSYAFNCPMPPKQNRFTVPIDAGEKNVLNTAGELLHEQ